MDDVARQRVCEYCDEPIQPGEGENDVGGRAFHAECFFRMVMGCVAHIEKRCSCFVPGSNDHDPEGMTRREAARAAFAAWSLLERQHLNRLNDAEQDDGDP